MPPTLRPRPSVAQQPPPLAKDRKTSAAAKPQVQSQPSLASKRTPQAKRGRKKQQDPPPKAQDTQGTSPTRLASSVDANPRSRQRKPPSTSQVTKQSKPRESKQKQSKAGRRKTAPLKRTRLPVREEPDERLSPTSSQPTSVASSPGRVYRQSIPEAIDNPIFNPFITGGGYLSSAPWYRSYGYGSPNDDRDMASASVVDSSTQGQNKPPRKPPPFEAGSKEFMMGLKARNVIFQEQEDEHRKWIKDSIIPKPDEHEVQSPVAKDEHNWGLDLLKCQISDEAVFQRTVMMDLIDRHQLADTLDYTCESHWECKRMPQRASQIAADRMPKPKPDLAVAFRAESILGSFEQNDLGDYLQTMCPEAIKEDKVDRAFHFLSIEVKGASADIANCKAHRQNFNTATQALHNIYVFMNMAGGELLDAFYRDVRFYSVVATSKTFFVRVHRAIKAGRAVIEEGYPLGFVFDTVYNHDGAGYTKATTTRIVKNILLKYGVEKLQPLLIETMEAVWQKLQIKAKEERRHKEIALQKALEEAEKHRSRGRAESRRSRSSATASRSSRKNRSARDADTSFTRQELDDFRINGSPS